MRYRVWGVGCRAGADERTGEIADWAAPFTRPQHPYTEALPSAVPAPDPAAARQRIILNGDAPSPINPPSGCRLHTRCPCACVKSPPRLSRKPRRSGYGDPLLSSTA